jgi:hypothetical protein
MVNSDWVLLLTKLQELLLETTDAVYGWVEDMYDVTSKGDSTFRDDLNMSAFIIDNTIVDAVAAALASLTTLRPSGIQLKSSGAVVMEGEGIKEISLKIDSMNTPTPVLEYGLTIAEIASTVVKSVTLVRSNVIKIKGMVNTEQERKEKTTWEEL